MSNLNNTTPLYTNTYSTENIYNTDADIPPPPPAPTRDPIILPDYPIQPNFGFITDTHTRKMIESAYTAICGAEGWYILRNFNEESFMFTTDQRIIDLMTKVDHIYSLYGGGHSGATMGITMRHMEYIAKNGFIRYKTTHRS
jgi:hypothetical protein